MKRILLLLCALVGNGSLEDSVLLGQTLFPFTGRGLTENKSAPPSWFKGSETPSNETKDSPRWFGGQGLMRPARPGEMEERPRVFGSFFQRPETNEPTLVQRANDRSREFWGRTRDWAADQNDTFKHRTAESWDWLSNRLRPSSEPPHQEQLEPFGGPVRIAEKPETGKTDRF